MRLGQAIARHLVFVLEDGDIVVQRGADVVESLRSRDRRSYSDFDRDHDATDEELTLLRDEGLITNFDAMTVWVAEKKKGRRVRYYYLDTGLPPSYLELVRNWLADVALLNKYRPEVRVGRVAILSYSGDPFANLNDAEGALMILQQALGKHLPELTINNLEVNPRLGETQTLTIPANFETLIKQAPNLENYYILLVESEFDTADFVHSTLESLGIELRITNMGAEALEIMIDEEPDLAIIDLTLPDLHGYEVIQKIRKDPVINRTPIIVLSDVDSEADVAFALSVAKVDDFLVKPVTPHTLRSRVLALLAHRI